MRDVESVCTRDSRPITTHPHYYIGLDCISMRVPTMLLLSLYFGSILASLPRFLPETKKPLPPSLDKRLLTAARLHLPVTCLVPPSLFPSPVVCIHGTSHPKSALTMLAHY